jgi:hypothetical protein
MAVRPHPPRPRPGSTCAAALAAAALSALAAAALATTLAGCGSGRAATPAGHRATDGGLGGRSSAAAVSTPRPASHCRRSPASVPARPVLTLRNGSNGGVFCAWTGQRVLVYLTGSAQRRWAAVRSDSAALAPAASGQMMLRLGVTGAAFAAARPGIAHLMSARAACAHGPAHCDSRRRFRVTVVVLAR